MEAVGLSTLVQQLRAAGEVTRARILALLAHGELSVGELAQVLNESQPSLSRHLKFLTAAGLVERLPEGAWVFYRLPAEGRARAIWSTRSTRRSIPTTPPSGATARGWKK